jgi:hypothetical protein
MNAGDVTKFYNTVNNLRNPENQDLVLPLQRNIPTMNKILVFLLLFPAAVFAQQAESGKTPVYLNISLGAAIPVGKNYPGIASSTNESKAGYAKTGMFLSGAVGFMGKNDFGFGLEYLYQKNNYQDTAKNIHVHDTSSYMLGSDGWTNHWILGGLFFVHKKKNFIIDGQLLGGAVIAFSNVFSLRNPYTLTMEGRAGVGLGWGINAGIGINLNKTGKAMIKFTAGYLNGYPSRSKDYPAQIIGYDSVTTRPIYNDPASYEIKKIISTVNIGAGLIFKL